jgi:ADP-heptose:LPS heptosyltransferase
LLHTDGLMTADAKQKILIRLPGTLQMMVRALPLLVQIREGFPLARITVLVQQKFKAVLRNISDIEVIAFVKKLMPYLLSRWGSMI